MTYSHYSYDSTYARIDERPGNPGYLTAKPILFATYNSSDKTLRFYENAGVPDAGDSIDKYPEEQYSEEIVAEEVYVVDDEMDAVPWSNKDIESVFFAQNVHPTSTAYWFAGLESLENVYHWERFSASKLVSADSMFSGCANLRSIDWSMSDMRASDITANNMFAGCVNLESIDVGRYWSNDSNTFVGTDVFAGCVSLASGEGTAFSPEHVDSDYARYDQGTSAPGYFTRSNLAYAVMYNIEGTGSHELVFYNREEIPTVDDSIYDEDGGRRYVRAIYEGIESNGYSAGWQANGNTTYYQKMIFEDPISPKSISNWFMPCQYGSQPLDIEGIEKLDTSEVTDMSAAFAYNRSDNMSELIAGFDTSQVTNMESMFQSCTAENIVFPDTFDTSKVTNMSYMFASSNLLTSLDLTLFSTESVDGEFAAMMGGASSGLRSMFEGCNKLESITFGDRFVTGNVIRLDAMFKGLSSLTSLDLSHFDTSNVISMASMFDGCTNLTSVTFGPGFVTSKVGTMSSFGYFPELDIYAGYGNGRITAYGFERMFKGCSSLVTLELSRFSFAHAHSISHMFDGCSKLSNILLPASDIPLVEDASYAFNTCVNLTEIRNISKWVAAHLDNAEYMFNGCSSLRTLDISSLDTSRLQKANRMFASCGLKTVYVGDAWTNENIKESSEMFTGTDGITGMFGYTPQMNGNFTATFAYVDDATRERGYLSRPISVVYHDSDGSVIDSVPYHYGMDAMPFEAEGFRGWSYTQEQGASPDIKSEYNFFISPTPEKASLLSDLDLYAFYEPITTYWYYEPNAKTLHINRDRDKSLNAGNDNMPTVYDNGSVSTSWREYAAINYGTQIRIWIPMECEHVVISVGASVDSIPVTSTSNWFTGFSNLRDVVGLGYLGNGEITDMSDMFSDCSNLRSVDTEGLDVSSVRDMSRMFSRCHSLEDADFSTWNTYAVESFKEMFNDCLRLSLDSIAGWDVRNARNMNRMFYDCVSMEAFDGSQWNAPRATDMSEMFSGCSKLRTADLSGFVPENVTDMRAMFRGCSSLESLDLSEFATPSVTDMSYMFYGCSSVDTFDLSSFDTSHVESMAYMFAECYALRNIDLTSFDTSRVTDFTSMFEIEGLHPGSVDNYYVHNPETPPELVGHVPPIKTLDLSSFDNSGAVDGNHMSYFLYGLNNLETVVVSDKWHQPGESSYLFHNPVNLVGGKGTEFYWRAGQHTTCARIDGGEDAPGYFTDAADAEAAIRHLFAVVTDTNELRFYQRPAIVPTAGSEFDGRAVVASFNLDGKSSFANEKPWAEYLEQITSVDVCDAVFLSGEGLFEGMPSLASVNRLSNLTLSGNPSLANMFKGCSALTSVNISSLDTSSITTFKDMFADCSSLETIEIGRGWTTANVFANEDMFSGCYSLVGGVGTAYRAGVDGTPMARADRSDQPGYMTLSNLGYAVFAHDVSITSQSRYAICSDALIFYNRDDVPDIGAEIALDDKTYKVMAVWENIEDLDPSSDWVPWQQIWYDNPCYDTSYAGFQPSSYMACVKSVFFEDKISPISTNGWFASMSGSASFKNGLSWLDTSNTISMRNMFASARISPDLTMMDTSNVVDMRGMFRNCQGIFMLDLSSFDTSNVRYMDEMFAMDGDYTPLSKIAVSDKWSTQSVISSTNMFAGCLNLVGGNGFECYLGDYWDVPYNPSWDALNNGLDASRAHIDTAENPGYLTGPCPIFAFYSEDDHSLNFGYRYEIPEVGQLARFARGWSGTPTHWQFVDADTATSADDWEFKSIDAVFAGGIGKQGYVPEWAPIASQIEKVIFFDEVAPDSTSHWFENMSNLDELEVLANLNTSHTRDMSYMFASSGVSAPMMNTFDMSMLEDMSYMFADCDNLYQLDLRRFDIRYVKNFDGMFAGCDNLYEILASRKWQVSDEATGNGMFDGCLSLAGRYGTAYAPGKDGIEYARLDEHDAPGYFSTRIVVAWYWDTYSGGYADDKSLTYRIADVYQEDTAPAVGDTLVVYRRKSSYDSSMVPCQRQYDKVSFITPFKASYNEYGSIDYSGEDTVLPEWSNPYGRQQVHVNIIDDIYPTDTAWWFHKYTSLVGNTERFHMDRVRNASHMFDGANSNCSDVVNNANFGSLVDASYMFANTGYFTQNMSFGFTCATSKLETMDHMFYCSSFGSISFGPLFDTSKITDMSELFRAGTYPSASTSLTTINGLSNFDTSNVTDMSYMFAGCGGISSLSVPFDTSNVTNMIGMFDSMPALTALDGYEGWDVSKVEDMGAMFRETSITCLDLSKWSTPSLSSVWDMFLMRKIETIYASEDLVFPNNDQSPFVLCERLVGGQGTQFSEGGGAPKGTALARIDGLDGRPGLFTAKADDSNVEQPEVADPNVRAFAVIGRDGMWQSALRIYKNSDPLPELGEDYNGIFEVTQVIDNVEDIDSSFDGKKLEASDVPWNLSELGEFTIVDRISPKSVAGWFTNAKRYNVIGGIENLDLSECRDMSGMFYNTTFTAYPRFADGVDTSNVEDMSYMFANTRVESYYGGQTANIIDLYDFDTSNVKTMKNMFLNSPVNTIYVSDKWSTESLEDPYEHMFTGCTSLVGGKGSVYRYGNTWERKEATYARVDGGEDSNAGLLTRYSKVIVAVKKNYYELKFYANYDAVPTDERSDIVCYDVDNLHVEEGQTSPWVGQYIDKIVYVNDVVLHPVDTSYWFAGARFTAGEADFSNIDTSKTTSMRSMFENSTFRNATYVSPSYTIDVSHFDYSNVEDMSYMFAITGQSGSQTKDIYMGSVDMSKARTCEGMLKGVKSYVSGQFFNATHDLENTSHMFEDFQGSFSSIESTFATWDTSGVKTMAHMFDGLRRPWNSAAEKEHLKLMFDTSNVEDMSYMFTNCSWFSTIDIASFDTSSAKYLNNMFQSAACEDVILGDAFTCSDALDMSHMFESCSAPEIDTSSLAPREVRDLSYMFAYCEASELDLSGFDTSNVRNFEAMLAFCPNLTALDISNFDTSKATEAQDMLCFVAASPDFTFTVGAKWKFPSGVDVPSFPGGARIDDSNEYMNSWYIADDIANVAYDGIQASEYMSSYNEAASVVWRLTSYKERNQKMAVYGDEASMYHIAFMFGPAPASLEGSDGVIRKLADEVYGIEDITDWNEALNDVASKDRIRFISFSVGEKTFKLQDVKSLFSESPMLMEISNLVSLDTEGLTDFSGMFRNCRSIDYINIAMMDTSKATSAAGMFEGCSSLATLDFGQFGGSALVDMSNMFRGCSSLPSVNLSQISTRSVVNVSRMFEGCSSLRRLDLSAMDTSSVVNASYMFQDCSNLVSVDVSKMRTSNVITMAGMFKGCKSLASLNLSSFDTSKVVNMSNMFKECVELANVSLAGFDTSNVRNMSFMFSHCEKLPSLDVSSLDTSKATTMAYMFDSCSKLASLDVSSFDTSNVADMSYMFLNDKTLSSLDVSSFDTSSVTSLREMFRGCSSLKAIDVASWDTSCVKDAMMTFSESGIANADLSGWNLDKLYTLEKAFYACPNLTGVYLGGTAQKLNNLSYMFANCPNLRTVGLDDFTFRSYEAWTSTDGQYSVTYKGMFSNCSSLRELDLTHLAIEISNSYDKWDFRDIVEGCNVLSKVTMDSAFNILLPEQSPQFIPRANGNWYRLLEDGSVDASPYTPQGVVEWIGAHLNTGYPYYTPTGPSTWLAASPVTASLSLYGNDVDGYVARFHYEEPPAEAFVGPDGIERHLVENGTLLNVAAHLSSRTGYKPYGDEEYPVSVFETEVNLPTGHFVPVDKTKMEYVIFESDVNKLVPTGYSVRLDGLFAGMTELKGVYGLGNVDMGKVVTVAQMFRDCSSLTHVDLSGIDFSAATSASEMFQSCSMLKSVDLTGTKMGAVKDASLMFAFCHELSEITSLGAFELPSAEDMSSMFDSDSSLKSFSMKSEPVNAKTFAFMFRACSSLESADMTGWSASSVESMTRMFYDCSALREVHMEDMVGTSVSTFAFMFSGCNELEEIDLRNMAPVAAKNLNGMMDYCPKIRSIDLSSFDFTHASELTYNVFPYSSSTLERVSLSPDCIGADGTSDRHNRYLRIPEPYGNPLSSVVLDSCWYREGDDTYKRYTNSAAYEYMRSENVSGEPVVWYRNDVDEVCYMSVLYAGYNQDMLYFYSGKLGNNAAVLSYADKRTDWDAILDEFVSLRENVVEAYFGIDVDIAGANGMFADLPNLAKFEHPERLHTGKVSDFTRMFANDTAITELDFSNSFSFDTSSATRMDAMFSGMSKLRKLDLSSFDTSNVTSAADMFAGLDNLEQISFGPGWSRDTLSLPGAGLPAEQKGKPVAWYILGDASNIAYSTSAMASYMASEWDGSDITWLNNKNLPVGSKAVVYGNNYDRYVLVFCYGDPAPTYTAPDGIERSLVEGKSIENISYVEDWTKQINALAYKGSIKYVDFLDASDESGNELKYAFTNMNKMFYDAYELIEVLHPENVDTSRVRDMGGVFERCDSLEKLDLSSWDMGNVENLDFAFSYDYSLARLDISGWELGTYLSANPGWGQAFRYCLKLTSITVGPEWFEELPIPASPSYDEWYISGDAADFVAYTDVEAGEYMCAYEGSDPVTFTSTAPKGIALYADAPGESYMLALFDGAARENVQGPDGISRSICVDGNGEKCLWGGADSIEDWEAWYAEHPIFADVADKVTSFTVMPASSSGGVLIASANHLLAPATSDGGHGFANMGYVNNLSALDVSNVEDFAYMFEGCGAGNIDVSALDMSYATTLRGMFKGCSNLTGIELSSDSAELADISHMFEGCCSLSSISLDGLDTRNVTDMSHAFAGTSSLASIDLAAWDTSNVADISHMFESTSATSVNLRDNDLFSVEDASFAFAGASNLAGMDLDKWYGDSAKDISHMFDGCSSITEIHMNKFAGDQVLDMRSAFAGCDSLALLDMNSFSGESLESIEGDIGATEYLFANLPALKTCHLGMFGADFAKSLAHMFDGDASLVTLDMGSLKAFWAQDISYMFAGCSSLDELILTSFEAPHALDYSHMFEGCASLISLGAPYFTLALASDGSEEVLPQNAAYMFAGCSSLSSVDASVLASSNITDMSHMFAGCTSLESIDASKMSLALVTDMSGMFENCASLASVKLSRDATSACGNMSYMFYNCSALASADVSGFDISACENLSHMFEGCSSMDKLDLSSFGAVSAGADVSYMLAGCSHASEILLSSFDTSALSESAMEGMFDIDGSRLERVVVSPGFRFRDARLPVISSAKVLGANGKWYVEGVAQPYEPDAVAAYMEAYDGEDAVAWVSIAPPAESSLALFYDGSEYAMEFTQNWKDGDSGYEGNPSMRLVATYDGIANVADWDAFYASAMPSKTYSAYYGFSGPIANIRSSIKSVRFDAASGEEITLLTGKNLFKDFTGMEEAVDLSDLDTSRMTDISGMFDGCSSISTAMDVSSFELPVATTAARMFRGCERLPQIDMFALDHDAMTDVSYMFDGCAAVSNLELQGWRGTELGIVNAEGMFRGMSQLRNDGNWIGALDMPKLSKAAYMFASCSAIQSLDLSDWQSQLTTADGMFSGCSALTDLNVNNFDTSQVRSFNSMFRDCHSLGSLDLSNWQGESATNMDYMFCSCSPTFELDMNSFAGSKVTSARNLFFDAPGGSAGTIDMSSFTGASISSFAGWFENSAIAELRLGSLTGERSKSFANMFKGAQLGNATLDLPNLSASAADDMSSMFEGCSIASLNAPKLVAGKATNFESMFKDCSQLTSLSLPALTAQSAQSLSHMFEGCSMVSAMEIPSMTAPSAKQAIDMYKGMSSLATLDAPKLSLAGCESFSGMFDGCSNLTSIEAPEMRTSNATSMGRMFAGCVELRGLDTSKFDFSHVVFMSSMFDGCSSLSKLELNGPAPDLMYANRVFAQMSSLESVDMSSFGSANISDMSSMFEGCSSLASIDISTLVPQPSSQMSNMFAVGSGNDVSLAKVVLSPSFLFYDSTSYLPEVNSIKVENSNGKWYRLGDASNRQYTPEGVMNYMASWVATDAVTWVASVPQSSGMALYGTDTLGYELVLYTGTCPDSHTDSNGIMRTLVPDSAVYDLSQIGSWESEVYNAQSTLGSKYRSAIGKVSSVSIVLVGDQKIKLSSIEGMFAGFSSLISISGIENLDGDSKPSRGMARTFYGCSKLSDEIINNFIARLGSSSADSLASAFEGCASAESIDLSSLSGASPSSFASAFNGASKLTGIVGLEDVSLGNAKDFSSMFAGCSSLTSDGLSLAIADGTWDTSATDMSHMFYGCSSLTAIPISQMSIPNARSCAHMFDGCASLTALPQISNTAALRDAEGMFRDCASLGIIDISAFDASKLENASYMFAGCSGASAIALGEFAASRIENASHMFDGASSVTSLPLPVSFDGASISNASYMFANMPSLGSLDLSAFAPRALANVASMFEGDSALASIEGIGFSTSAVTDFSKMFAGCESLVELDLASISTKSAKTMASMFEQTNHLEKITLSAAFKMPSSAKASFWTPSMSYIPDSNGRDWFIIGDASRSGYSATNGVALYMNSYNGGDITWTALRPLPEHTYVAPDGVAWKATLREASELLSSQGGTLRLESDQECWSTLGLRIDGDNDCAIDLNGHDFIGADRTSDVPLIEVAGGATLSISDEHARPVRTTSQPISNIYAPRGSFMQQAPYSYSMTYYTTPLLKNKESDPTIIYHESTFAQIAKISVTTAASSTGNAVAIKAHDGSKVTLRSGLLTASGKGISLENAGFEMAGGVIAGITSSRDDAGIAVDASGNSSIRLSGGLIVSNGYTASADSTSKKGVVHMGGTGSFVMTGKATFASNYQYDANATDSSAGIYLEGASEPELGNASKLSALFDGALITCNINEAKADVSYDDNGRISGTSPQSGGIVLAGDTETSFANATAVNGNRSAGIAAGIFDAAATTSFENAYVLHNTAWGNYANVKNRQTDAIGAGLFVEDGATLLGTGAGSANFVKYNRIGTGSAIDGKGAGIAIASSDGSCMRGKLVVTDNYRYESYERPVQSNIYYAGSSVSSIKSELVDGSRAGIEQEFPPDINNGELTRNFAEQLVEDESGKWVTAPEDYEGYDLQKSMFYSEDSHYRVSVAKEYKVDPSTGEASKELTNSGHYALEVKAFSEEDIYGPEADKENGKVLLQYYAYIDVISSQSSGNSLDLINTEGTSPQNNLGTSNNPTTNSALKLLKLNLNADGTIRYDKDIMRLYKEEQVSSRGLSAFLEYNDISEFDKYSVIDPDRYRIKEVWVLKPGAHNASTARKDFHIKDWEQPDGSLLEFAYAVNADERNADGDAGVIYYNNESVIRFVADAFDSSQTVDANFYDYNITDGQVYASAADAKAQKNPLKGTARTNAINAAKNGSSTIYTNTDRMGINTYAKNATENVFGFGNANTGTGLNTLQWKSQYPNKFNGDQKNAASKVIQTGSFQGCTFGMVRSYLDENGMPVFNGLSTPALFGDAKTTGKTAYNNGEYSVVFKQVGNMYVLDAVRKEQTATSEAKVLSDLSSFSHPGKYTNIWTNNFWPMDFADAYVEQRDGTDIAFGKESLKSNRKCVSRVNDSTGDFTSGKYMPLSDDALDHNSYFGMNFDMSFELSPEYEGPLYFYFYGDDDLWVYLDGELICDIGGVHSSVGYYVDLRKCISEDALMSSYSRPSLFSVNGDSDFGGTVKHTLSFFYNERGASGSSCWMQLMVPDMQSTTRNAAITFEKTDQYRNAIDGAMFEIYEDKECQKPITVTGENNQEVKLTAVSADGKVSFNEVDVPVSADLVKDYYIKEVKPAPGYDDNDEVYTVYMSIEGMVSMCCEDHPDENDPDCHLRVSNDATKSCKYSVINYGNDPVALPETGGLGLLMIAMATIGCLSVLFGARYTRRRKEAEHLD